MNLALAFFLFPLPFPFSYLQLFHWGDLDLHLSSFILPSEGCGVTDPLGQVSALSESWCLWLRFLCGV